MSFDTARTRTTFRSLQGTGWIHPDAGFGRRNLEFISGTHVKEVVRTCHLAFSMSSVFRKPYKNQGEGIWIWNCQFLPVCSNFFWRHWWITENSAKNLQVDLRVDSLQLTNPLDSATDLGCLVYWATVETWENFLLVSWVSWTYTPHESNNIRKKKWVASCSFSFFFKLTLGRFCFPKSRQLMRTSGAGHRGFSMAMRL